MDFRNFISPFGLIDVNFHDLRFTWCVTNGFSQSGISVKFDWIFMNDSWLDAYNFTQLVHLNRIASDHYPMLLKASSIVEEGKEARCEIH